MSRFVFDIETNGLLPELTKLHSLVLQDIDTGELFSYAGEGDLSDGVTYAPIPVGLARLAGADLIAGHNSLTFDIPAIQKVYPGWKPKGIHRDTRVLSQLIHSDLKKEDGEAVRRGKYKDGFKIWSTSKQQYQSAFNSHALAAWGLRLGVLKGEYTGGFDQWSPEMQDYCEQDVRVTLALWKYLRVESYSQQAIELEHRVAELCRRVEETGIPFDVEKAGKLQAKLTARREEIKEELVDLFPPWEVEVKRFIAKVSNKKLGRVKGDEVVVTKTVQFNPGSRDHIARCLTTKYGWKPTQFTEKGKPQIDDEVLASLDYPEAKPLAEYFLLDKRLGALAEGDQAWLKVERKGFIHAAYCHNGTPHGRMSHFSPNISQVPKVKKPYGPECRALFANVPKGWLLGGADMKGMQDRMLAHFLHKFDGGRYAKIVSTTDAHEVNREAFGMFDRGIAKNVLYTIIFGGANPALADYIIKDARAAGKPPPKGNPYIIGKRARDIIMAKIKGFDRLTAIVKSAAQRGYLKGLDGRHVPIRSPHSAMNFLLANADTVCCKDWMVTSIETLEKQGLKWGFDEDFVPVVMNHDEIQIAFREEWRDLVHQTVASVATAITEKYKLNVPLAVDFKTGRNWAETH